MLSPKLFPRWFSLQHCWLLLSLPPAFSCCWGIHYDHSPCPGSKSPLQLPWSPCTPPPSTTVPSFPFSSMNIVSDQDHTLAMFIFNWIIFIFVYYSSVCEWTESLCTGHFLFIHLPNRAVKKQLFKSSIKIIKLKNKKGSFMQVLWPCEWVICSCVWSHPLLYGDTAAVWTQLQTLIWQMYRCGWVAPNAHSLCWGLYTCTHTPLAK